MSLRFSSVGLFCSLVAIAFAANHAADDSAIERTRGPASIAMMHKEEKLGPYKVVTGLKHTEKVRGPLSVKLEMMGPKPAVGEVFVLRGTIASRKLLANTNYLWSVSPGVEIVNGQVTGTVSNVDADQPAAVELTLRKVSEDNVQVHLLADSVMGETRFGDSAHFDSDSVMLNAPKTAVINGLDVETPKPNSGLKIFH